jgi:hypothetical protein
MGFTVSRCANSAPGYPEYISPFSPQVSWLCNAIAPRWNLWLLIRHQYLNSRLAPNPEKPTGTGGFGFSDYATLCHAELSWAATHLCAQRVCASHGFENTKKIKKNKISRTFAFRNSWKISKSFAQSECRKKDVASPWIHKFWNGNSPDKRQETRPTAVFNRSPVQFPHWWHRLNPEMSTRPNLFQLHPLW